MLQKYPTIWSLLFLLFIEITSPTSYLVADDAEPDYTTAINRLIDNGGYAVKKDGQLIATQNLHEIFVPASIVKIATASMALDILGPQFRFNTNFYLDGQQNLYIQGFGDPFLISEEVAVIFEKLKELGCPKVNDIYLDNSAFELVASFDGAGKSDNPYDAQNSALAVNFNTVHIKKEKSGEVLSAEEQTPTLAVMAALAEKLQPGIYRINITQEKTGGAALMSRYVGELFRALQQQGNITGEGMIARRKIPENLPLFYTHRSSKTLEDIIGQLMLFSNNFIANQLFLTLGANKYGYPATWEKSVQAMAGYLLEEHNLPEKEIKLVEGSGLSRKNRASPHAMMKLLDSFKSFAKLLPQEDGKFLKSGTLKGVYSYAGYFMEKEKLDNFVLILNQETNYRDHLLQLLEKMYRKRGST